MSAAGRPLTVGWKVSTLATNIASVRYRAVLPMIALEPAEVRSRLFSSGFESDLDGLDVLVIVKSFTLDDVRLAQRAAARGLRVVYDLCDNVFVEDYGGERAGPSPARMFLEIAAYASCIVTTTEPLAEVIRAQVGGVPVVVIPDGIEVAQQGRILEVLQAAGRGSPARTAGVVRQRVRNAVGRVRVEGPRAIPALMGRVGGVLMSRVRQRLHAQFDRPVPVAPVAGEPDPRPAAQRIVWFGNHGAPHASFGMLDILEFGAALEAIAAERDVELVVVSNSLEKYLAHIRQLRIPSRYVQWSPRAVDQELAGAALAILPNSLDAFSICKSANRTVTALSHGVPVVATRTPALAPLAQYIHTGEPLAAFRQLLAQPEPARQAALAGYQHAQQLFGPEALREHWRQLLAGLQPPPAAAQADPELAVVLHLIQDLDLALPVLQEALRAGVAVEAWCSAAVLRKSPRVLPTLRSHGIRYRVLPDDDSLAGFTLPAATRALLTIAETNLGPHRVPRLLTESALRQGRFTATMQHGFENVGLTYDEPLQGLGNIDIAAARIYLWGPLATLHPKVREDVRARCVPVGCPKPVGLANPEVAALLPAGRPIVGVFENLHWHRYGEAYRAAFLANTLALARAFPDVLFLLKPHHAGLWLTSSYQGAYPAADNLLVIDPQSRPWEDHTASALLPFMRAVVTTPSTVALDAARIGLPVAVVAEELALPAYEPLTRLAGAASWEDFVRRALDPGARPALEQLSLQFTQRVLVPGDAARRIVEDLRTAAIAFAAMAAA